MASIAPIIGKGKSTKKNRDQSFRILFSHPFEKKRVEIIVSKTNKKQAEVIRLHIEKILASKISGQSLDNETSIWIKNLPVNLRKKLEKKGLIDKSSRMALGSFIEDVFLNRDDVERSTIEVWKQTGKCLINFFGKNKALNEINHGQALDFYRSLSSRGLSQVTVAKRIGFARSIFGSALRHKLISENPFDQIKPNGGDNNERQYYVETKVVRELIKIADPNWKIIIALCRFGGLRCPSEVLSLRWSDVDWENNRIVVHSPKTKRYLGKNKRVIPLFSELRPHLQEAKALSDPQQAYVVGGDYLRKAKGINGWRNCNIRKPLVTLIKSCGYEVWPKLFHNLRSSCETDLLDKFPLKAVAKWFGHSEKIAMKHYAQVTPHHFKLAVGLENYGESNPPQIPPLHAPAPMRTDIQPVGKLSEKKQDDATVCGTLQTQANNEKRRRGDSKALIFQGKSILFLKTTAGSTTTLAVPAIVASHLTKSKRKKASLRFRDRTRWSTTFRHFRILAKPLQDPALKKIERLWPSVPRKIKEAILKILVSRST